MGQPEDEGTPYITPPELLDDDRRNGLTCFLDIDRVCGADCMAHQTFPSESTYLNDDQKHCTVLVAAERLGRYSGGILKHLRDATADSRRSPGASAPVPGSFTPPKAG
jgi:hypothetical protein